MAVTLTINRIPENHLEWRSVLNAWLARQERAGMLRVIYCTEFIKRGIPHLHAVLIYPKQIVEVDPIQDWVDVAHKFGALFKGQQVQQMDAIGWLGYLGKSLKDPQRHTSRIPDKWNGKTGRMWGRRGNFNRSKPITITCQSVDGKPNAIISAKRMAMKQAIEEAREHGNVKREAGLYRMAHTIDNPMRGGTFMGIDGAEIVKQLETRALIEITPDPEQAGQSKVIHRDYYYLRFIHRTRRFLSWLLELLLSRRPLDIRCRDPPTAY